MNRAPLHRDLNELRSQLSELLPILEADRDGYASIYFERKTSRSLMANLKQTNVNDQVIQGVVLRIYNGYTLFEQATDDLAPESLKALAKKFAARVSETRPAP